MGRKSIAWWHDENIGNHELVKVRITNKVSNYRVGAKIYYPGDIVEVPEFAICDFMARVVTVEEVPEAPEAPVEEQVEPEPAEETQPKTTRKKRTAKKVTEPEPASEAEAVATNEKPD